MSDMGLLLELAEEVAELKARVAALEAGGKSKEHQERKHRYTVSFRAFWAYYPRKESKGAAMKAWSKLSKGEINEILQVISEYAASEKGRGQYCPYASTWLNARRWEDDRSAWGDRSDGKESVTEYRRKLEQRLEATRQTVHGS